MSEYWVKFEGEETVHGPYSKEHLREWARNGQLAPTTLISRDRAKWFRLEQVRGLIEGEASAEELPLAPLEDERPAAIPPVMPVNRPAMGAPQTYGQNVPPAVVQNVQPAPVQAVAGEVDAFLPWGFGLAALALSVTVALVAGSDGERSSGLGGIYLGVLAFWSWCGAVASIPVLVGVWRRHALAYRFGVVFGPLGSGFLVLALLGAASKASQPLWLCAVLLVALGVATPIVWSRARVKRYFGLVCPACGDVRVGAESFAYSECRCKACNTVFKRHGGIIWTGGAAYSPPAAMAPAGAWGGAQPQAYPYQQPAVPAQAYPYPQPGVPVMGYAGMGVGMPGRTRSVGWYVGLSIGLLALGLPLAFLDVLERMQRSTSSAYGTSSPSPNLEMAQGVVGCVALPVGITLGICWLVWVYRVHKEIRDYTGYAHSISPGQALGFCFIPLFNLFWSVYMPYQLAKTLERYHGGPKPTSSGTVLAFQILAIIPGSCVFGLGVLFWGLGMLQIQKGLNALWERASYRQVGMYSDGTGS